MGILISKFRKKKNTVQELNHLEKEISDLEKVLIETHCKQRKIVGKFLLYSIALYLLTAVFCYFYFSSGSWKNNFIYVSPFLVIPFFIYIVRKFITWYYKRQIRMSDEYLLDLKDKKKKLLEEVMEKETYKTAKEILEKYAPEQLNKESLIKPFCAKAAIEESKARQRITANTMANAKQLSLPAYPSQGQPYSNSMPYTNLPIRPKMALSRPIMTQYRGAFEKLVDMLIGDGPNNRYALICKVCSCHNGMALAHEFEYIAFRCAYCFQMNPARKQKPQAPNIERESPFYLKFRDNSRESFDKDTDGGENTGNVTIEEMLDEKKYQEEGNDDTLGVVEENTSGESGSDGGVEMGKKEEEHQSQGKRCESDEKQESETREEELESSKLDEK